MTDIEIAWAAGLFDGEGSTSVNKSRGKGYLALQMNQVRREVLDRFAAAVGAGNVTGPYKKSGPLAKQSQYGWRVYGQKAYAVLELLRPHLSLPKIEQADAVLARLNGGV